MLVKELLVQCEWYDLMESGRNTGLVKMHDKRMYCWCEMENSRRSIDMRMIKGMWGFGMQQGGVKWKVDGCGWWGCGDRKPHLMRLVGKKCLQVQLIFYSNSFHRKMMFFVVDDADKMVIHIDKARLPKASNLTCYTHAQIHSSRHTHTSMHTHTLALSHTHTYKCWSIPHGQATRVPQSLNKERHLTILFQCSHKCFILMEMPDSL